MVVVLVLLNFQRSNGSANGASASGKALTPAPNSLQESRAAAKYEGPEIDLAGKRSDVSDNESVAPTERAPVAEGRDATEEIAPGDGNSMETREKTLVAALLHNSGSTPGPSGIEPMADSNLDRTVDDLDDPAGGPTPKLPPEDGAGAQKGDDAAALQEPPDTAVAPQLPPTVVAVERVAIHHESGILGVPAGERLSVVARGPGVWIVDYRGVRGEVDAALVSDAISR